jgi:L-ascorbate metabolism protein UlaG (beta-lactamase superfamily)
MLRLAFALSLLAAPLAAQERIPSHCIAIAQSAPGIAYASASDFLAPLDDLTVRLRYVDHSMFLIRTPGGLSAATDYTGYLGPTTFLPDVVTMNNAHSTHWTPNPSPDIPHVLRGWAEGSVPADHYLDLGEMLVRNVPTDVRSGFEGVRVAGNSIFVFEVAGLCIGHLGHLHHEPDEFQYAALGRLDVVMAPVDGGMTLDLPTMIRVLKRLRSSVVIPMHWFSTASLDRFVTGMQDEFDIQITEGSEYEVSLRSLPSQPTVVVLRPEFLDDAR